MFNVYYSFSTHQNGIKLDGIKHLTLDFLSKNVRITNVSNLVNAAIEAVPILNT
jgi:hypothetical protein